MGGIEFDDRQLTALELDLSRASLRVQFGATKTLRRASELVDVGMKFDAAGHVGNYFGIPGTEYVTPLPEHVSHEMIDAYTAEIGIESKGAGKLAHIIVFGSVNNAPVYDHTAALRRSTPKILEMFGEMGEQAVLGENE